MSTVAIVMTTYNGEKYVGEQIDSILASTFQDFELFIYDDSSKDNTLSILRTYEQKNPMKLHVFENETNLGVTENFLKALCRTTTDYIMFCDQDDFWKPNKIAVTLKRLRHMEAQVGKGTPMAVFTDAIVADVELKTINSSFFRATHLNSAKTDLGHLLMENKLIGCTVMVNAALRRVLQSYIIPSKAKYHDWWVALIASSMGKIGFVKEATLLYRQHGGNVVGGTGFLSYFKNRITSLKKQKESILALEEQAKEFLIIYDELLTDKNREILQCFADLNHRNFIEKRIMILRYGYLKTGFIRNIGLLLII
jgi:glycosyltransferase involved in cell wall biosynthesis